MQSMFSRATGVVHAMSSLGEIPSLYVMAHKEAGTALLLTEAWREGASNLVG